MKTLLFLFISLISLSTTAQQETYWKLKVFLKEGGIQSLANQGITVEHGHHKAGVFIINDFPAHEKALLDQLNYEYEVITEDVTKHYLDTRDQVSKQMIDCGNTTSPDYEIPENFNLGSMGGYFTYEEIWGHIDNMQNLYPDLITIKAPINDSLTHNGNPLYWVKISDNPNLDEDEEPEMLYTALHHAREPGSVSQLIFYMYYLLENYGSDEQITALVNHAELFFIPVINPDGYLYNESTNPNGGGMWRKNRRDNQDGTYGVDLNRNYSFHWAEDNQGSSPSSNSETYRGPGPASEPETQMVNQFCTNHHFELALNYHSYGGLFIYPWGYADPSLTPDSSSFYAFGQHLTQHNHYTYGTGSQTVGYTVNGDSDDWMYGEQTLKNKILTMTPEAGSAFWENTDLILPTCLENLFPNIGIASILFPYADVLTSVGSISEELNDTIAINIQNIGLQAGSFSLSLESDNPYVLTNSNSIETSILEHLSSENSSLNYSLSENTPLGTSISMDLVIDNGMYATKKPINFLFGGVNHIVNNDGNSLDDWTTNDWNISYTDYYSANGSITDSPFGDYSPDNYSTIVYNDTINLLDQTFAKLSFYTKWDIESGWDYAQVSASLDYGDSWHALCGLHTKEGNQYQDYGQPIYDGLQENWIQEVIDLEDYLGEEIMLRFILVSDGYVEQDGFYFDDVQITGSSLIGIHEQINNFSIYPNPSNGLIRLKFQNESSGLLQIANTQGQIIFEEFIENTDNFSLDASNFAKGVYLIKHEEMNQIWIKN